MVKKSILIALGVLVVLAIVFVTIIKDPELTPETQIWITNNSGVPANIVVEYTSEACPNKCRLELGTYATNEGRGTRFPVPNEGSFKIMAQVGEKTLISDSKYVEKSAKISPIIWNDKISLD